MITPAEADSEHQLVLSKGQRLNEKKDLVRAVSDKRQLASNGLLRCALAKCAYIESRSMSKTDDRVWLFCFGMCTSSIELENTRSLAMLKEAKAETRKMRDRAHARTQDLKMQIDAMKDINVKYQNKSLATTTELETSQQSMKFEGKMLEEKLESMRTRTESTKEQFDFTAENVRQAQSHLIQAREAIAACEEEEKAQADEIKSVHACVADKDREFHHIFQSEKASEDFARGLQRDHADETRHLQVLICRLAICKMSHYP